MSRVSCAYIGPDGDPSAAMAARPSGAVAITIDGSSLTASQSVRRSSAGVAVTRRPSGPVAPSRAPPAVAICAPDSGRPVATSFTHATVRVSVAIT